MKSTLLWSLLPLCVPLISSALLAVLWYRPLVEAAAFVPSSFRSSRTLIRPVRDPPSRLPRFAFSVDDSKDNNNEDGNGNSGSNREEKGDEEEDENPSSPSSLRRKRDRIRDWISSSSRRSGTISPMVRPIRMEDGSIIEDPPPSQPQPSRLKSNFGDLFSGMPSVEDILKSGSEGTDDSNNNNISLNSQSGDGEKQKKNPPDESWFEEERKQIEANYAEILKEMTRQLEEQRRQDPDGVPSNAEAMVKDILRQEMNTEIAETKETRAKERLEEYQKAQQAFFDAQDMEGATNEVVDNLMKEDKNLQEQRDAEQARIDDYRRYELEAFLRKPDQDDSGAVNMPKPNSDLDQWALESLKVMAEKSQNGEKDEEFMVTDLVEERMEELRGRIEKEASRSSIKPETMKEWQMYRSIASRLGIQADAKNPTAMQGDEETERKIASQLQSWKDYNAKEEVYRKDSGLARGPKLPFEWQESGRDKEREEALTRAALKNRGEMTQMEIRKEVNRKSIEALEKLVATSDPIRSERLKKDLELLKESLESNDYLDVDESTFQDEEEVLGPVDLSDFFASSREEYPSPSPQDRFRAERDEFKGRSSPSSVDPSHSFTTTGFSEAPAPPPDTPFFSSVDDDDQKPSPPNTPFFFEEDEETKQPPPTNTPFFSQEGDDTKEEKCSPPDTPFFSNEEDASPEKDEGSGYRLGSIEEQKLRNMYQRAGARTDEQKAVIRKQWEEFQKFEKSKRDQSGLGDGDDSEWLSQASLKYNMTELTKDGDIDAEKILASIGPRPKRRTRKDTGALPDSDKVEEGEIADNSVLRSDLNPEEVSDSLYRAVSAVGGGRTRDDPEAKAKEKAEYAEYMSKEDQLRRSLDDLDEDVAGEVSKFDDTFDDKEYAEDALASLGCRPAKRRRITESEYSDQGIALSDEDEDEDDDDDEERGIDQDFSQDDQSGDSTSASDDGPVPGWLRKERESARRGGGIAESFLGSDIDDVFDDDTYEHNMRQLVAKGRLASISAMF